MSAKPTAPSRAGRYRTLVREAAREFGLKPSDERIEHIATLRLMAEDQRARIISGASIDTDAVLKITAELRELMPVKAEPLTVHFVDGSDVCIKCRGPLPPREERGKATGDVAPIEQMAAPKG